MLNIVKSCSAIITTPLPCLLDLTVKKHMKENFCYLLDVFNALIVYFRTTLFARCETYTYGIKNCFKKFQTDIKK